MKSKVRHYTNFKDVEYDLKRLNLQRKIAFEELKGIKYELKEDLTPPDWVEPAAKVAGGYALFSIIKHLLKQDYLHKKRASK